MQSMTVRRELPGQLHISGQLHIVDPDPAPTTIEAAWCFLRNPNNKCKATMTFNEESDRLTIKIQASDNDGNVGHVFEEVELPPQQGKDRDDAILKMVKSVHAWRKARVYGGALPGEKEKE